MKFFSGIAIVLGIIAAVFAAKTERDNHLLQFEAKLLQSENRILKDQVSDMVWEVQQKGTYDQGYQAALVRTNGGQGAYSDGYDDAMKVVKDSTYTEGYHNALAQFGDIWFRNPWKLPLPRDTDKSPIAPKTAKPAKTLGN